MAASLIGRGLIGNNTPGHDCIRRRHQVGVGDSEFTPVETALPVDSTVESAKRVVETGSLGVKPRGTSPEVTNEFVRLPSVGGNDYIGGVNMLIRNLPSRSITVDVLSKTPNDSSKQIHRTRIWGTE